MYINSFPEISIVIIGLNEEKNLDSCFTSIIKSNYPQHQMELIYVDSGSKDRSVEIANKYTSNVYIEKHLFPTAARSRNRGLVEAKHNIVHFVDGDIQIDSYYLLHAIEIIQNKEVDAVSGKLLEKENNFYNRTLSSSWVSKNEGYTSFTSAGGTYKRQALLSVNGYDERLSMGEETELGQRFLKAGYRIWYTEHVMGIHNYGIENFAHFIKKQYNDGVNKSKVQSLQGDSRFFIDNKCKSYSNLIQHISFIFLVLFLLAISKPLFIIWIIVFYFLLIVFKYIVIKKVKNFNSLVFFILMNFMKPITFYGQIKELFKIFFKTGYKKSLIRKKMQFI